MKNFIALVLLFALIAPQTVLAERLVSIGLEMQSVVLAAEFTDEFVTTDPSISTSIKHSGEASLRMNPTAQQMSRYKDFGTTADNVYFRFYLYIATGPSGANFAIATVGDDANGNNASIYLNTDLTLSLYAIDPANGFNYSLVGSPSSALNTGQWYRIELFGDVDQALWNITVRIDGVDFVSGGYSVAVADIDWVDVSAMTVNPNTLGFSNATADIYFDDIAVNDAEVGTTQISWPGEGNIVHMTPDSDGDTNNCSAGSTGGSGDYTDIDDSPFHDGATSFCELDDNNEIIEVNLESSSSAGIDSYDTVTLVESHLYAAENPSGTGSASYAGLIRSASGGTRLQGTRTQTITNGTYSMDATSADSFPAFSTTTDPTTGIAWTPTGTNSLDNMQIGVISPDAEPDLAITMLWALVEYVDGSPPGGGATVNYYNLFDDE